MKLQPNLMVRQRELKPVTSKGKYYNKNGKLDRLLKNIKRSSISERILICAITSPDNSEGVFLDDRGHEYLIKATDLNSDLTYISSKFVKKKDKKYSGVRYPSPAYQLAVKNFLRRPDVKKNYKGWFKKEGLAPAVQINEEETMYEVGKCYTADDGDWSFKVLKVTDDYIQIQDLTDNRKYKVEVSDLELANPDLSEEEGFSEEFKKLVRPIEIGSANIETSIKDVPEIIDNLIDNGLNYKEGDKNRQTLDALIQDAKKLYNNYLVFVKGSDYDLNDEEKEYLQSLLTNVNKLRHIDLEEDNLEDIKSMFKEEE